MTQSSALAAQIGRVERDILDASTMEIKEIKNPITRINLHFWQSAAEWMAALAVCAALFSFRLHSLVPGFSAVEQAAIGAASSLKVIALDPSHLAHKLLQYLGLKLDHDGFIAMRLPSVIAGLVAAALFFYVINKWFNLRIAVISSFLLVSSSWFLHLARIGTPEVTYLGILAPLTYAVWLPKYKRPLVALGLGALILINTLYTPGLIWFTIMGLIWQRRVLGQVFKELKIPSLFVLSGCIVLLVPLAMALVKSPDLIMTYLGLPSDTLQSLRSVPQNLIDIPAQLAWRGPDDPVLNLGRLPLLDFFTVVMAVLGGYSYATHAGLQRSRMLLGSFILGCLLVGLGGAVSIALLLPFVYLLVAGGLNFMIEQWFKVFPYNPFARTMAIILLLASVSVVTFYHVNNYFIAWPQAPATKEVFNIQPRP